MGSPDSSGHRTLEMWHSLTPALSLLWKPITPWSCTLSAKAWVKNPSSRRKPQAGQSVNARGQKEEVFPSLVERQTRFLRAITGSQVILCTWKRKALICLYLQIKFPLTSEPTGPACKRKLLLPVQSCLDTGRRATWIAVWLLRVYWVSFKYVEVS
jgi:hypothetical protein